MMKDGKFETHKEMLEFLLNGGKVKHAAYDRYHLYLNEENILTFNGDPNIVNIGPPFDWSMCEKPKKKSSKK